MTIGAHHASGSLGAHSLLLLTALLALALTIYVAYRLAAPLFERLGDAGVNALVKLNVRAGLYLRSNRLGGLAELLGGLQARLPVSAAGA